MAGSASEKLAELYVEFKARGLDDMAKGIEDIRVDLAKVDPEDFKDRMKSSFTEIGEQTKKWAIGFMMAVGAATAMLKGFVNAGLAGTTTGNMLSLQFKLLYREIAATLLPALDYLSSILQKIILWFRGLSGDAQALIGKIIAFSVVSVTLIGTLTMLTSTVLPGLISMVTGLGGIFGTAAGGVTKMIAVVVQAGGVIPALVGGLKALKAVISGLFTSNPVGLIIAAVAAIIGLVAATEEGRAAFKKLFAAFAPMAEALGSVFSAIADAIMPIIEVIVSTLIPVIETIADIVGIIAEAFAPFIKAIGQVIRLLGGVLKPIIGAIGGALQGLKPILDLLKIAFEAIAFVVRGIFEAIRATVRLLSFGLIDIGADADRNREGSGRQRRQLSEGGGFEAVENVWKKLQESILKTNVQEQQLAVQRQIEANTRMALATALAFGDTSPMGMARAALTPGPGGIAGIALAAANIQQQMGGQSSAAQNANDEPPVVNVGPIDPARLAERNAAIAAAAQQQNNQPPVVVPAPVVNVNVPPQNNQAVID